MYSYMYIYGYKKGFFVSAIDAIEYPWLYLIPKIKIWYVKLWYLEFYYYDYGFQPSSRLFQKSYCAFDAYIMLRHTLLSPRHRKCFVNHKNHKYAMLVLMVVWETESRKNLNKNLCQILYRRWTLLLNIDAVGLTNTLQSILATA